MFTYNNNKHAQWWGFVFEKKKKIEENYETARI